jgi:hypothetical protein
MNYGYHYLFCGLPLGPIAQDMESYGQEARQFGLTPSITVQFPIMFQTTLNLQGKSLSTTRLEGEAMDETSILQEVSGKQSFMTFRDICTFRLMLAYLFRDLETLREMLDALSAFPVFSVAIARSHLRQAFTSLGAFLLYRNTKQKKWLKLGNKSVEYFHDAVRKGSMNAYPIYTLLLAEQTQSKQKYDEAIRVCSRSGLLNFEAIANENVARYFDEQGDKDWATFYVTRSLQLYEEWGALGKATAMRHSHEHLLAATPPSTVQTRERRGGSGHLGRSNYRKSIARKIRNLSFESQMHLFGRGASNRHGLSSSKTSPKKEESKKSVPTPKIGSLPAPPLQEEGGSSLLFLKDGSSLSFQEAIEEGEDEDEDEEETGESFSSLKDGSPLTFQEGIEEGDEEDEEDDDGEEGGNSFSSLKDGSLSTFQEVIEEGDEEDEDEEESGQSFSSLKGGSLPIFQEAIMEDDEEEEEGDVAVAVDEEEGVHSLSSSLSSLKNGPLPAFQEVIVEEEEEEGEQS